jgi:ABC-2 type transport system permease protein
MAVRAGTPPFQPLVPVSRWSRVYGLGGVYAKTLRDSRRAFLFATLLLAGLTFLLCFAIPMDYTTQKARDDIARIARDLAATAQGTSGKPINVGTVGGYVQWKYGPIFLLIASIWSILALSSTLAGEARSGSLDLVAASPMGKRRIAIEKIAGHVTVMAVVLAIMAVAAWSASTAFGKIPADVIPMPAALAYVLGLGLSALFFGGLALALTQFLGRSTGAGIAGTVLIGGWIANGYGSLTPLLAAPGDLTPWAWTADFVPLAGQYDWRLLAPLALLAIALLAIGAEVFARRDVGAAASIQTPGLPAVTLGLRGPVSRALGERLPFALAWGIGIGVFGLAMAGISKYLADQFGQSPDIQSTFRNLFPGTDVGNAASFLQLLVQMLFIVAGFAAATFVAGWTSDETSGRLEMLLTAPVGRGRWAALSGIGVYLAAAVMTGLAAAGIGIGALMGGMDPLNPLLGSLTLGLFAAAAAGVGFAVGGAVRASIAAEIVVLFVVVTYLTDFIAPALKLPDWVHQLALTAHLGQPIAGHWDWAGVVACLAIAAAGLLIGAWGVGRRDING